VSIRVFITALVMLFAMPGRLEPGPPVATNGDGPLLYVFFATWCVPCRAELPAVEMLRRKYASQGLRVMLVSEDSPSSASEIPVFLARLDVNAPWVLDRDSALLEKYNPAANLPFVALLDGDSKLIFAQAGYESGDERILERWIQRALKSEKALPGQRKAGKKKAPPLELSSTNQALAVGRSSRFDPLEDSRLVAAAERFELSGKSGPFVARSRVDGAIVDDSRSGLGTDLRVERFSLDFEGEALRARVGDGYAMIGHGLSLSLRRIDPLGLDTTLRGGRARVQRGSTEVLLLAGTTNNQNLDPITFAVQDDVRDVLGGFQIRFNLNEALWLSPHAVVAHLPGASFSGRDVQQGQAGLAGQLKSPLLNLSFDGAAGLKSEGEGTPDLPWALWIAATGDWRRFSWLVDAKAYRLWELGRREENLLYHEPPTLERDDQQVPGNADALGPRTRLTLRIFPWLSAFSNLLGYRYTQDQTPAWRGHWAFHGYGGAQMEMKNGVVAQIQSGLRREMRPNGEFKLSLWHLDIDATSPIGRRLAISAKWNHRSETRQVFSGPRPFVRGLAILGLALPNIVTLSALYGYTTEISTQPVHHPGAELAFVLPKGGLLRFFAGRLTGGRVCVSGTCRQLPPFEGVRTDFVLRF
jgi:thiol-disulfide isomerase/thioredoxin